MQLSDATIVEGNSADCSGGGIYNSDNATLNILGAKGACKISNNKAGSAGGGIYSYKATVKIQGKFEDSGNEVSGNESATGGGILTYQGSLDIRDAVISQNYANMGAGLFLNGASKLIRVAFSGNRAFESGAGAYAWGERIYMEDVLFDKNEAGKDGSGIYNEGNLEVLRGKFSNNTFYSSSNQGNGGGIYNEGNANIRSSTFFENHLGKGGGIYNNGPLKVAGCTFFRNWGATGGAIYNQYINEGGEQEVRIINSTLSGNMTDSEGGGIYNGGSEVVLVSSTLSDNTEFGKTGNIHNAMGIVKLQNTLLNGNQPGSNCTGTYNSLGYNLSSDGSCDLTRATDLPDTSPLLAALADNGGDTQTHAFLAGSPAINKIPKDVNLCGTSINIDQRGITRPQPLTGKCDIGAYEKKGFFRVPGLPKLPLNR
ncbi:MAG: hypothetical protein KJ630_22645 [Proteobacteria bacterium]|nr:hypothetical protein [Pseudomonadota bacterium]